MNFFMRNVGKVQNVRTVERFDTVAAMIAAARPTEPVYCFYPQMLQTEVDAFLTHFPGNTMFAVKANPDPYIILAMYRAGIRHFDTASLQEIELIRSLCPEATCYYMAPVKFPGAAHKAYFEHGVRHFVVDHKNALEAMLSEIDAAGSTIFVRMAAANKDAVVNLSKKYGATPEDTVALLNKVKEAGAEPALAFNVGSLVRKPDAYRNALASARQVLSQIDFPIRHLDVGGGFPASHQGIPVPELTSYFEVFHNMEADFGLAPDAKLFCEPGRSLVASCMSTVTRVLLRKNRELYINDGMYGSFSELATVNGMEFPVRTYRGEGLYADGADLEPFTIYGPTCCSLDQLPREVMLPADIREGDWIEFGTMGAYSLSNRTKFNGFYTDRMIEVTAPDSLPPRH